jgi:MtrB/PioB family decaheme-associated outer membrane protein
MRTRITILFGALLIASAGLAQAQDTRPTTPAAPAASAAPAAGPKVGEVDFGFRTTGLTGDEARFDRYNDVREGPQGFIDGFRVRKESETLFLRAQASRIGYRDQAYFANVEKIGRVKASFAFTQMPLFLVNATTLFTDAGNGLMSVADNVQQGIQGGTLTNAAAVGFAQPFDVRDKRSVADFNMIYTATRDLDVKVQVRNNARNGHNLMAFNIGNSPGNMTVLDMGVPVDDRNTDLRTKLEWANRKGLLSVGYDASWYNQNVPTLVWDNPLRYTDSATAGAAQGRTALWPTNNTSTFNVSGSYKLPGRSKASAALSFGTWNQNEALLPNTINSALPVQPLERPTADAKADITSLLFGFTSRPADAVWLNATVRYYDYVTKTPVFDNIAVVGDYGIGVHEETEPADFKRLTFDADASFTPFKYLGFNAGYSRENGDRTFRIYEKTAEDVARVSVDSLGSQYVTARLKYEYSKRTGSNFDDALLPEIGEQPALRHFDIAPRDRHRITALVTVTPLPQLAINGSVGTGRDKYPDSYFGLKKNDTDAYSAGFDIIPNNVVDFGLSYGVDKYSAFQWSRTASPNTTPPQFTDPTRDWGIDSSDKVKTLTANLDLIKAFPKTDIRFWFDLSDGTGAYVYQVPANSTIPAPVQYTTQPKNKIEAGHADLQYFFRPNVALGAGYEYRKYSTQDPAFDPLLMSPLAVGSFAIYSGYAYRPYTANTGFIRVTYLW